MPQFSFDDGQLYYYRSGAGWPVVFVNDWPLSHHYWGLAAHLLRPSFSVIGFDPRGAGKSQLFSEHSTFDIETQAEDLHRLIVGLGLSEVHLVGHSIGALVAGLCLNAHPQDVRTITIINPLLMPGDGEALDRFLKYTQVVLMLKNLTAIPLVRNVLLSRYSYGRVPGPYRKPLIEDFLSVNVKAAWETIHSATEEQTLNAFAQALASTNRPVLIIACTKDKLSSGETARWLYGRIKTGSLVTLNTQYHFPMLESPERFTALLKDFYDKSSRL
jgi:pimeloyl-ACP methyl ester carboxylesterase